MNRMLPVSMCILCLAAAGVFCGCQTTGYVNDYSLDYVPVDDLGDLDAPVAYEYDAVETSRPAAEPAPVPAPAEPPRAAAKVRSDGRVMQTSTMSAMEMSSPLSEFGMRERRFVKQDVAAHSGEGVEMEPRVVPAARVTHVNLGDKYVILQCETLPKSGEDAQIFRGDQLVGVVRFVSSRRGRYIVADIVSGEPQRGDLAKFKVLFPRKHKPKSKPKPKKAKEKQRPSGLPRFL